jgi:RNA recognition motif-containing protein
MNMYVGNLSYTATEDDLRSAFEEFGTVDNVNIIRDRETGNSRGFGFVEMGDQSEAQAALSSLNGQELQGRMLRVNEARPRENRDNRGGMRR